MSTLPQLIEEDIRILEAALDDFLAKSESSSALILDKGGFIISERGDVSACDTTTLGALAAAAYAATQGIAGLVQETTFSNVYQQGESNSILVSNIDEHCLLVAIFRPTGREDLRRWLGGRLDRSVADDHGTHQETQCGQADQPAQGHLGSNRRPAGQPSDAVEQAVAVGSEGQSRCPTS